MGSGHVSHHRLGIMPQTLAFHQLLILAGKAPDEHPAVDVKYKKLILNVYAILSLRFYEIHEEEIKNGTDPLVYIINFFKEKGLVTTTEIEKYSKQRDGNLSRKMLQIADIGKIDVSNLVLSAEDVARVFFYNTYYRHKKANDYWSEYMQIPEPEEGKQYFDIKRSQLRHKLANFDDEFDQILVERFPPEQINAIKSNKRLKLFMKPYFYGQLEFEIDLINQITNRYGAEEASRLPNPYSKSEIIINNLISLLTNLKHNFIPTIKYLFYAYCIGSIIFTTIVILRYFAH